MKILYINEFYDLFQNKKGRFYKGFEKDAIVSI